MNDPVADTLSPAEITAQVRLALNEDIGSGDLTSQLIPESRDAHAVVIAREAAVICGRPWFDEVFAQLASSIRIEWRIAEGELCTGDAIVCELSGPARPILSGERTALNFLQLLSGTATRTREYAEAVAGSGVVLLDTRKTVPGLRLAQKYAVRYGGARNHRLGLYDAMLIKENHIICAGSIEMAVTEARSASAGVLLEVEVESPEQLDAALRSGADRLLLDNFTLGQLLRAVERRDRLAPKVQLEASGGIRLETIARYARSGVDFISVGALTKDVTAIDLSMRFRLTDR